MGFFPKITLAFGMTTALVVPFVVFMHKSNSRPDGQPNHLSYLAPVIDTVYRSDTTHPSANQRIAQQTKKKPKKKPVIRVGKEPVQLGKRTLRILQNSRPPTIQVVTPIDPSYVDTEWITVRVRSEPRAYLKIGDRPLLETAKGIFAGKIQLRPGKNQLTIQARDTSGNTASATVSVTWIDERKMHETKDRLKALMVQLDEIQKISREIDARTEKLIQEINTTQDADTINRLSRERQEINQTKLLIQSEIQQAIQSIDSLLAKRE